jgi:hypothetical protein
VVFPQNAYLAVLVADRPAVKKQAELGRKRNRDGDDRREVEVVGVGTLVLGNLADGFHNDDDGHGDHERAETEVARGFDARLAAGEFTAVDARDGAVAHDQGEVGERVEERVGHGGEEREGLGGDCGVELQHC